MAAVVSTVETESVDFREEMRSSPLNTPRAYEYVSVEARFFDSALALTPHGQDGGAEADSLRSSLL